MVVGEMSSFTLHSSFSRNGESNSKEAPPPRATSGMKSFVNGMMSPFTACWQPDPGSCVPGCASDYHTKKYFGKETAVVSPLVDRLRTPRYDRPTSPVSSMFPQSSSSRSLRAKDDPTPLPSTDIQKPHSNDVLCGRGGSSNRHLGNMHFRELVAANKKMYTSLTKKQKMLVARKIVDMVHNTEPAGRFLAKDLDTGRWYDIGLPRSLEKTSQALREKNSNDYPVEQGTEVSEVLSDVSMPSSPRSDSGVVSPSSAEGDKPSSKISRSSKNVEAPPLTIPAHLSNVFGPKRPQETHHAWPDYSPSSRHLDQGPYGHPYGPADPTSPRSDHSMPRRTHHYESPPPPQSPSGYHSGQHRYGRSEPPPHYRRPSSYGHPESPPGQDYRDHYDYYHGQPSPHRSPPPPSGHYRGYSHAPHPPPSRRHDHHLHHRPTMRHHHGLPPHGQYYSASRMPGVGVPAPRVPPSPPDSTRSPQSSPMVTRSPSNAYVRGKSEVSPDRRQEWKRQRNEQGVPHRLSEDTSLLSSAVENSLSLEERVVGRERTTSSKTSVAATDELPSRPRELTSPSGTLQGRSRPRGSTSIRRSPIATPSLTDKEGDAVSALSGLAALSTAAFLKLDETD